MMSTRTRLVSLGLVALLPLGAACGSNSDSPQAASSSTTTAGDAAVGDSGLPQGDEQVDLDPASFAVDIDNKYWPMEPGAQWTYREIDEEGNEAQGRGHRHHRDQGDRQRRHRPRRARHRHRGRRADRGHLRLVRPGRRRERLVPRRGHRRVRGRRDHHHRRLVGGRRRRRAARHHHARRPAGRHAATGRSTTRARPRTTARCSAPKSRPRCPFGHFDDAAARPRTRSRIEPDVLEYKLYAPGVGPVLVARRLRWRRPRGARRHSRPSSDELAKAAGTTPLGESYL